MKKSLTWALLVCFLPIIVMAQTDTSVVSTYIISSPPCAEVYVGRRLVGCTPLSIDLNKTRKGPLILRHAGYKDCVMSPASIKEGLMMVKMVRDADFDVAQRERKERMFFGVPVQLIGGVGVASGVAAAYFKINADKMFSNYQSQAFSGHYDDRLLKKVNQYDRYSAASLVVMEICAAALVYYLFRNE